MKQYFVYKNPSNAAEGHIEISGEAFYSLTAANNLLPKSKQRYFALYDPHDDQGQYLVYFETSHRGKNAMERADRDFKNHEESIFNDNVVSLDDKSEDKPPIECEDTSNEAQVDKMVESICFMEQAHSLSSERQEWADMVDMYAIGEKRECNSTLARKYGTCVKTMFNHRERLDMALRKFARDWM